MSGLIPSDGAPVSPIGARARQRLRTGRHFAPVLTVLVVFFVGMSVWQSAFLTTANVRNLLTGVSVLWVISLGQTFAVLSGGLDLSVGATATLAGILLAKSLDVGIPVYLALVLALVFGAAIGAVANGLLIGWARLSFFVVTLASMTALTGAANLWSKTHTFFVTDSVVGKIGFGSIAGLPTSVWLMIATLGVALYVQSRTYFGRDIYATGGSVVAARLSGVRTERTIVAVYAVCGLCAAIGGIIATGRIGAASPQVDGTLPLNAAAAVLLGGTVLSGGAGGVGGTAIGVLFIGALQNGLSIAGIPSFWQQVVTGLILVLAIAGGRGGRGRLRLLFSRRPVVGGTATTPAPEAPAIDSGGAATTAGEDTGVARSFRDRG